jgi:hypothetical protein
LDKTWKQHSKPTCSRPWCDPCASTDQSKLGGNHSEAPECRMPHISKRIAFDRIGRRHRSGNPAAIKPSAGIAT